MPMTTTTTTCNPTRETEWLTIMGAAARVGVSRRTIYNWLQADRLNWRYTVGGSVRIDAASLWGDHDGPRRPWEPKGEPLAE